MEQKNKGFVYLILSFFLWLIYSLIELSLSRFLILSTYEQKTNPSLTMDLLLTFSSGFRYVLLFFAILFFLTSVYRLSFAYPEKRNKIALILNLICLPLFLIIGFFVISYGGNNQELDFIVYSLVHIPVFVLGFLAISFFISKFAFRIDSIRKKEKKHSIFFWPVIITSIGFFLLSALFYSFKDNGFRNYALKIFIDALTGFSNSLPFVLVYIPIAIVMFFIWAHYAFNNITDLFR